MWSISPVEWGEILKGKTDGKPVQRVYHAGPDDYSRWVAHFAKSPTAVQIIEGTESATDFFSIESDVGRLIPRQEWTEAFYSLKLGYNVPGIPMQFLYFAKLLFEKYRMCNVIGPAFPKELAHYMGKPGYFADGYTPMDALRSYVYEDFAVVTEADPIAKCGSWYEVYLPTLDMVCALPPQLATCLSKDDVSKILVKPGVGLVLGDTPIVSLGGLKGVSRSVFDLREAV